MICECTLGGTGNITGGDRLVFGTRYTFVFDTELRTVWNSIPPEDKKTN